MLLIGAVNLKRDCPEQSTEKWHLCWNKVELFINPCIFSSVQICHWRWYYLQLKYTHLFFEIWGSNCMIGGISIAHLVDDWPWGRCTPANATMNMRWKDWAADREQYASVRSPSFTSTLKSSQFLENEISTFCSCVQNSYIYMYNTTTFHD